MHTHLCVIMPAYMFMYVCIDAVVRAHTYRHGVKETDYRMLSSTDEDAVGHGVEPWVRSSQHPAGITGFLHEGRAPRMCVLSKNNSNRNLHFLLFPTAGERKQAVSLLPEALQAAPC